MLKKIIELATLYEAAKRESKKVREAFPEAAGLLNVQEQAQAQVLADELLAVLPDLQDALEEAENTKANEAELFQRILKHPLVWGVEIKQRAVCLNGGSYKESFNVKVLRTDGFKSKGFGHTWGEALADALEEIEEALGFREG